MDASQLFWLAPAGSIIALLFSYYFYSLTKASISIDDEIQKISDNIETGTKAYVISQLKTVSLFFIILFALFAFLAFVQELQSSWMPIAFLTGGFFSALCNFIGIKVAKASSLCCLSNAKTSLNTALKNTVRGSSIFGLMVVSLVVLDISVWWKILTYVLNHQDMFKDSIFSVHSYTEITSIMLTFGIGALTQTLFSKVGGGIFTSVTRFSNYLLGPMETDLQENDVRNPAVISEYSSNNISGAIGTATEFYDILTITILTAMTIGASVFSSSELVNIQVNSIILPLVIIGSSAVSSILGVYCVSTNDNPTLKDLMNSLSKGSSLAAFLTAVSSLILVNSLIPSQFPVLGSTVIGLTAGIVICWSSNYHTAEYLVPTSSLINHSLTGTVTIIVEGIANSLHSLSIPAITISSATIISYGLANGFKNPAMGFYGIAMASVGMLSIVAMNVSFATLAPVIKNATYTASKIDGLPKETNERLSKLVSLGEVACATQKGFSISSTCMTVIAILGAYLIETQQALLNIANYSSKELSRFIFSNPTTQIPIEKATFDDLIRYYNISITNPVFLLGILLGISIISICCTLSMKTIYKSANKTTDEINRQLKEIPGLLKGEVEPDYTSCVSVASFSIHKHLLIPISISIVSPMLISIMLGPSGIIGMIIGAVVTSFAMGTMFSNLGSLWKSVKRGVEADEEIRKSKESVCGADLASKISQPLTDVASSSLNLTVKIICIVSIIYVGFSAKYSSTFQYLIGFNPSEVRYQKEFAKANGLISLEDIVYSSTDSSSIYEDPLLGTEDIILPTDEALLRTSNPKKVASFTDNQKSAPTKKEPVQKESFNSGFDSFKNQTETKSAQQKQNTNSGFDGGFDGGFDSFDATNSTDSKKESDKAENSAGFDGGFDGGFDSFDATNSTESKKESNKAENSAGLDGGFDSFSNITADSQSSEEKSAKETKSDEEIKPTEVTIPSVKSSEEVKNTEETKSDEKAKPVEEAKPSEEAKSNNETKPATDLKSEDQQTSFDSFDAL